MWGMYKWLFVYFLFLAGVKCSDITKLIFGSNTNGMPAAFGDFDSDELTDVFVIQDNGTAIEILLAHEEEPILRSAKPKPLRCVFNHSKITSVVPGDFDGDAFMDVLVTTLKRNRSNVTNVHILWGGATHLDCSDEHILEMIGQPLAIDVNQDMIVDLFGENLHQKRVFWIFGKDRERPKEEKMEDNKQPLKPLKKPHSHAFLDLNDDYTADLFITTQGDFEIWHGTEDSRRFIFNRSIPLPFPSPSYIGQASFIDAELRERMDLLIPVCVDNKQECHNSKLMMYSEDNWHDLLVDFKDPNGVTWRFAQNDGGRYTNVITLYHGDFNMDGYPDILTTLSPVDNYHPQSFLLENVASPTARGNHKRTYVVRWNALNPFTNGTVLATFFDLYQDGILDVILVTFDGKEYKSAAFKNSLDYDANFIKVMVLTGLTNKNNQMIMGRVGKKRRTYGTNLPGPRISYSTTTQEGNLRHAAAAQLPQSAHFSLNLPYTIFGLGRTPNFVDFLTVGLSNHSKDWPQIIPNSQMVVIPWPPSEPNKWRAQLFVTPSKLILMSVAALTGVCGLITLLIGVLYWKERQEDKKERLSESHRFHFDAM
ncbi:T-cell immunomodulatory protein [Coccinella septempunctata]|uniref:T-cell immunomodulatory protein n=1 Tax=Coccinella septempunctata TaxID=41139 RepID=UPI001D08F6ED|nr:T-cell immunomodulatory protein [Coccinella septempunctata]